jgi:hypothetical protein
MLDRVTPKTITRQKIKAGRVNHPITRLLTAAPPLFIGVGFGIRITINSGPPLTVVEQVQDFATVWVLILEVLCAAAVVLAFGPVREQLIKVRAAVDFALACWCIVIAVLIFLREPEPGESAMPWLVTREYTSTAVAFAVAIMFLSNWWADVHIRLRSLRALEKFEQQYRGE